MQDRRSKTCDHPLKCGCAPSDACQTPAGRGAADDGQGKGWAAKVSDLAPFSNEGSGVMEGLAAALARALHKLNSEVDVPAVVGAAIQYVAREHGGVNLCFPVSAEGAGRRSDTKARRDGFIAGLKAEVIRQLVIRGCDQDRREAAGAAAVASVLTAFSGGSVYIPSMAAYRQAEQHAAIVSRYRAGERTHEIAASCGISERSVRRILQRSRERNRREGRNWKATTDRP